MPPHEKIKPMMSSATVFGQKTVKPYDDTQYDESNKVRYCWRNIMYVTLLHTGAVYGIYLIMTRQVMWKTNVFWYLYGCVTATLGTTAGAHRLWAHKAYKARWPLRLCLMLANSATFQGPVINWARDHRMHHRHTETDADPHNSKRGFWFSHIGWLLVRKHPDIKAKGHTIDISDLKADPILRFQQKYILHLNAITNALPVYIATLWGENVWNAVIVCVLLRITITHHFTFLVNSAAHMWGNKPYDKHIAPVENKLVSFFIMGEGFHNYHHSFPWDYKASELGNYSLNPTALFIEVMAKLGLAYDLKTADPEVIKKRMMRTGDGTHAQSKIAHFS